MPSLSNYPPGVSGNEPQITGEDDNYNMDEVLKKLVCLDCGEAFDGTAEGVMYAEAHESKCDGSSYIIQDESEAM